MARLPTIAEWFTACSAAQHTDTYRATNNVPRISHWLTLDYSSLGTCEGQLKAAILEDSTSNIVQVIAEGMGGIGKTCALQGLATQEDVRKRFPDGLLYIELGNAATKQTVMKKILKLVRKTGGKKLAKEMGTLETLQEVIEDAADWFEARTCLFLVDDVWNVNGINSSVLLDLTRLAHRKSRLVYTTRDKKISSHGVRSIEFRPRDEQLSRKMLIKHAFGDHVDIYNENEEVLQQILAVCGGHPLAIGIAGGSVRELASCISGEQKQDALRRVATHLRAYGMVDDEDEEPFYGSVSRVVDSSLSILKTRGIPSCHIMFEQLSLLRKKNPVPVEMLQKLWGVSEIEETRRLVFKFHSVALIQLRFERDEKDDFFHVHDLILDVARHRAGGRQSLFISNMLNRYMTWRWRQHRQWWMCKDDGFIYDNLSRLLVSCNCKRELLWLLARPQWIIVRLEMGGMSAVQNDLNHGLSILGDNDRRIGSQWRSLKVIEQAAHMSHRFVLKNTRESWFQLYGRLLSFAQKCNWTEMFTAEIDRCAPRPWSKPKRGFLDAAGGALAQIIPCDDAVVQLSINAEKLRFLTRKSLTCYDLKRNKEDDNGVHILRYLERNGYMIACKTISGDGKQIALGSQDGSVRITQIENGKIVASPIERHDGLVQCIVFSADGKQFASGSIDNTVRVWKVDSCEAECAVLKGHTDSVQCVAFNSDGRLIASGSDDWSVRVWSVVNGQTVSVLKGHRSYVNCIAFSAGEEHVASGSNDRSVRVWNFVSGRPVNILNGHTSSVTCVAYSREGRYIASGSDDKSVNVWNVANNGLVKAHLKGHSHSVLSVGFSENGKRVVSGSVDKTVRIWDINPKQPRSSNLNSTQYVSQESHEGVFPFIAVSGDGSRVVAVLPGPFIKYCKRGDHEPTTILCKGPIGKVTCMDLSFNGKRLVLGTGGGTVQVWNVGRGCPEIIPLEGHAGAITCVAFTRFDEWVVSGSVDQSIRFWKVRFGELITVAMIRLPSPVNCLAVSWRGDRLVAGGRDNIIRVWKLSKYAYCNADSHTALLEHSVLMEVHVASLYCLAISGDGKVIAAGSADSTVSVWNVEKKESKTLDAHWDKVTCLALNGKGDRLISGSADKSVRVWDLFLGIKVNPTMKRHKDVVRFVAFLAAGVLSGSSDMKVQWWNMRTGRPLSVPIFIPFQGAKGHNSWVQCIAVSKDRKWVATGSADKTMCIWNVKSGHLRHLPFERHTDLVRCVAFSGNGKLVVSGSDDGIVRVWSTQEGIFRGWLVGHKDWVRCVVLSDDGRWIVSGSRDKTMRVWDMKNGFRFRGGMTTKKSFVHKEEIRKVAVDEEGNFAITEEYFSGIQRLWELESERCVAASDERMWESKIQNLSFAWSPDEPKRSNVLTWSSSSGKLTLGTVSFRGFQVGKTFFNDDFSSHCTIEE